MLDWLRGSNEKASTDDQGQLGSISMLDQDVQKVILEITDIRENLMDAYPSEAFLYLSQRFEQLSKRFLDYTIVSNDIFYDVIRRSNSRSNAVKKVSQQANVLARLFEKYSRGPKSYSGVNSRLEINKLLGELKNLQLALMVGNVTYPSNDIGSQAINTENIFINQPPSESETQTQTKTTAKKRKSSKSKTEDLIQANTTNNESIPPPSSSNEGRAQIRVAGQALADKPSIIDMLGYETYVTALANFIESPKTQKPLTIGIDAAWGRGKTTLMHMLEERLGGAPKKKWLEHVKDMFVSLWKTRRLPVNPPRFCTVWFNAWVYNDEESLWAAMALEIWSQARKRIGVLKRGFLALKINRKRIDWGNLAFDLFKPLLLSSILAALIVLAFAGLSLWLGKGNAQTFDWLKNYIKAFAGLGIATLLYTVFMDFMRLVLSPFSAGISRYLQQPDYASKIGFIREFQQDFKNVVESVTQNGKWPLAIFVDDLDRCSPNKAAEVIEAINLLLDSEYCVFIIGMDSNVLSSSIQAKYKEIQPYFDNMDYSSRFGLGHRFLEKIIQIDFRVPQPDKSRISDFIDYQLGKNPDKERYPNKLQVAESLIQAEQRVGKTQEEAKNFLQIAYPDLAPVLKTAAKSVQYREFEDVPEVIRAINELASYLDYNPRRIKRFINMYRLQALIAEQRGLLDAAIALDNLAYWVVISMRWPEFVNGAIKDTRIISQIRIDILKLEQAKDKIAKVEQIRKSGKYSSDVLALLTDSEFAELLNKITGKVGDAGIYFHLSQLSITS